MIRPLTIATFLLACGSGLYLYQEKHDVQVLDRTIERAVKDTAQIREQSRMLAAEWTMLNDPERLREYSDKYLALKSIAPTQFAAFADLNKRLPAILPPTATTKGGGTDEDADVADGPRLISRGTGSSFPPVPPLPLADPADTLAANAQGSASAASRVVPPVSPALAARAASGVAPSASRPPASALASVQPATPDVQPAGSVASVSPQTAAAQTSSTQTTGVQAASGRPPAAAADATSPPVHAADHRVATAEPRHPADATPAPKPAVAEQHPPQASRPPVQQTVVATAVPAHAPSRPPLQAQTTAPSPVTAAPVPVAAPYGAAPYQAASYGAAPPSGSLLGMAHSAPPAPRPLPTGGPNWSNAN